MSQEETQIGADEIRAYELAFHLVPTLSEAEALEAFNKIKSAVEKVGKVSASSEPTHIPLAYVMEMTVESRKRKYNTAYFAWVKFEAEPAVIDPLQKDLDLNTTVLRYMTIKADKENAITTAEVAQMLKGDEESEGEDASKEAESAQPVEAPVAAEEPKTDVASIDKAIDDLVGDDKAAA